MSERTAQWFWRQLVSEVTECRAQEPALADFYDSCVLNHQSLAEALSFHLASKLASKTAPVVLLQQVFEEAFSADASIVENACKDMQAYVDRDPACDQYGLPFLYFKGYQALQAYRVAHWLWQQQRQQLALFLQNAISVKFDVDIHPGANIGQGIMIDHATGVVIGETAVVGDNVSLLHSVTLGGSGCGHGDRHPKVGNGVLISTGAKLLGNISIGEGAKIAAGSLVLNDVSAHTTVAGVPARVVGRPNEELPALDMNQQINEKP
jgi:serine O-acetyltransferase